MRIQNTSTHWRTRDGVMMILPAAFLAAFARSPSLLLHGRLFAEEGTEYLRSAWNLPWWKALFLPHQGYFSLLDNCVAAVAVSVFPLQWAALVFTWSAMLVLMLMVYCYVTCEAFPTTSVKAMVAFLCIFCPSIEVWMTLEDSQFCLAAAMAILLVSDPARHRLIRCFTTVLAGLTGPVACSLVPFAIVRAIRLRSRVAWAQAWILTACCLLQGSLLVASLRGGSRRMAPPGKWIWVGPIFAVKSVALTFFLRSGYTRLMDLLRYRLSPATFLFAWLLALAGLLAFAWIAGKGGRTALWIFAMAVWSFIFAYEAVLDPPFDVLGGDNRYFYLTTLLLWVVILLAWVHARRAAPPGSTAAPTERRADGRLWTTVLLVLISLTGLRDVLLFRKLNQETASSWPAEVAHWRADPQYQLQVSPADWPRVQLERHGEH